MKSHQIFLSRPASCFLSAESLYAIVCFCDGLILREKRLKVEIFKYDYKLKCLNRSLVTLSQVKIIIGRRVVLRCSWRLDD